MTLVVQAILDMYIHQYCSRIHGPKVPLQYHGLKTVNAVLLHGCRIILHLHPPRFHPPPPPHPQGR